ncbi:hypothetical protein ANN_06885 [Periplaneta americana]|uniref:C2H2-type domain-containing protein n=1 Tax=Periplaneta americana TaxID=6978 RepID=A0ABQ8TG36_PERAM|nr:hypothetical protein ANN_06885 [Periplaneta americana]
MIKEPATWFTRERLVKVMKLVSFHFVMDLLKTEPDIDPLGIETSHSADVEEKKPLSEVVNLLNLHFTRIKEEYVDHNYDLTSEMKLDDTLVPFNFARMKCKAEEELDTVEEELKLKVAAQKDERSCIRIQPLLIFRKINSVADCQFLQDDINSITNCIEDNQTSNISPECAIKACAEHVTKEHSHTISISSQKPPCESTIDCQNYEELLRREDKMKTECRSKSGSISANNNVSGKIVAHCQSLGYHTDTDEKKFRCDVCEECFLESESLDNHMRVHTGEKNFKCDICGKYFSHSGYLTTHKRQHTGERPFKCSECGKTFSQSGHLKGHVRRHTGEKPFRCDSYGKCFSHAGNLKAHKRKHTGKKPFKCRECDRSFSRLGHLETHARQHSGEKPFKCDICGKCFSQPSCLQRHHLKHTGEKPFQCDICGKCFLQANSERAKVLHEASIILIDEASIILIDEASMIPAVTVDCVDHLLRDMKCNDQSLALLYASLLFKCEKAHVKFVVEHINRWRSVRYVCYHNLFRTVFCAGKFVRRVFVIIGSTTQIKCSVSMLTVEVNVNKYVSNRLNPLPISRQYVFPNSSHSCHYRRYRTYRYVLFRMNAVLARQLLWLIAVANVSLRKVATVSVYIAVYECAHTDAKVSPDV